MFQDSRIYYAFTIFTVLFSNHKQYIFQDFAICVEPFPPPGGKTLNFKNLILNPSMGTSEAIKSKYTSALRLLKLRRFRKIEIEIEMEMRKIDIFACAIKIALSKESLCRLTLTPKNENY